MAKAYAITLLTHGYSVCAMYTRLCIYILGIRIYADASRSYHRLGYNNNDCPSAGSAHAALVFWPDGPVVDPGLLA